VVSGIHTACEAWEVCKEQEALSLVVSVWHGHLDNCTEMFALLTVLIVVRKAQTKGEGDVLLRILTHGIHYLLKHVPRPGRRMRITRHA
jgi:hypothetical protein